jgi:hypothetical protein
MNNTLAAIFLPGIIVFALTGLTIVAYKFPCKYSSLYKNLAFILIGAVIAANVWTYAIHKAFHVLSRFIASNERDVASNVINSFDPPWWLFAGILAIGCYLSLLSFLPNFFGSEKSKNKTGR